MNAFSRALKRHWQWLALAFVTLVPRLYLLRVYDIELSQDGFDAVNTLTILQTQGIGAVPRDLMDRFILHPLYMLLLAALRLSTPASIDFYFAARLLSSLIACVAVILLFEFTRRAFGDVAAWVAALFLAFAPSFLWESVAILSSTLFLALYIAVLFALWQSRYRLAAFLAFLSAITRYEGVVLITLLFATLFLRDFRARKFHFVDWLVCGAFAFAFPLTLVAAGALAAGNALEFIGAQSMAAIWLRFLAPGDFARRGAFFITQYAALFPALIVWFGIGGAVIALVWQRSRATALLLATSALYVLFFEVLVWLDYTTLEVRFLMYPGLPLLVFAGWAISIATRKAQSLPSQAHLVGEGRLRAWVAAVSNRRVVNIATAALVAALCVASYQQGDAGMRFIYNMMASQREVADELAHIVPLNQRTNLMVYTGNAGALDLFARQRGMQFSFTDFRFAPDDNPEQFLIDRKIQFVVYPVGNAFAKAKYPYLARFETQTHGAVTFQPLTQFSTSTDNQLYSIWAVSYP
jgi:hypothetical protein